jgi:AbrB family looped-hinge helix DNA binding protein
MLSMTTVKVSRKNQIAVPAAVRRRLGIRPGDVLDVEVEGSRVVLRARRPTALADLLAIAPDMWRGADAERYVDELRGEWTGRER